MHVHNNIIIISTLPQTVLDFTVTVTSMELQDSADNTRSTLLNSDDGDTNSRERLAHGPKSDLQAVPKQNDGVGLGEKEWRCSPSSWDWKKLLLITSLWWSYFLINGAHSMIAPFFPNEVLQPNTV